jgi:starvation-inducible DNA-binding protein
MARTIRSTRTRQTPKTEPATEIVTRKVDPQPILNQRGRLLQPFGTLVDYQIGLDARARKESVDLLNAILADSIYLRDMYKKAHWQVSGHTFYQLHLLYQAHYDVQACIVDMLAERVQTLGGVSLAVPQDVATVTNVERPPACREQVPEQLSRLLEAHTKIIVKARAGARIADRNDDLGTNDLLMSEVLRPNEKQVWFLSEHLVDAPAVVAIK